MKTRMVLRWALILAVVSLGCLVLAIGGVGLAFARVNQTNGELESGGLTRRYLLYVPDSYNPDMPTPLVISIHGFAEWPAHQMEISGWNTLADQHGFIVVYPQGTSFPLRWTTHAVDSSAAGLPDDTGFIADLIDRLSAEYNIDPQRIYANGLSNGGGMSNRLACELADRIAAIGGVSGAYLYPPEACQPARPVPVIAFHGTADEIVPYNGGPSRMFDIPFPLVSEWAAAWAERNGCAGEVESLAVSPTVDRVHYTGCNQNAEVVFYTIAGGGHAWPGGEPIPEWIVGYTTMEINATRLMWEFFSQHPLPTE